MADFVWRGDAQVFPKIVDWVITGALVGDTFSVGIGVVGSRKTVSYTLIQDDIDDNPSQSISSVAMRKLYALLAAAATKIGEYAELSFALRLVGESSEVEAIRVTGQDDGAPFDATLTAVAATHEVNVTVVQQGSAGQNEIQVVSLGTPTGGDFTLTFSGQTTTDIAYDASAATVDAALEALSNIGAGDVAVSGSAGGPWTVTFQGAMANTNQPQMVIDGSGLTGSTEGRNRIESLFNILPIGQTNAGVNKLSLNRLSTVSGGTYTITNETLSITTEAIDWDATWLEIRTILEATFAGVGGIYRNFALLSGEDENTYPDETIASVTLLEWFIFKNGDTTSPATSHIWSVDDSLITGGGSLSIGEGSWYGAFGSTGSVYMFRLRVGAGGDWTDWLSPYITSALLQAAIEGLPEVGDGNVSVSTLSGSDGIEALLQRIEFIGDLSGVDVEPLELEVDCATEGEEIIMAQMVLVLPDVGAIEQEVSPRVTTSQQGVAVRNEIQSIELSPTPDGGTFTLTWDSGGGDQTTADIDFDAAAADVETALEGLASIAPGDVIVTGSAGGPWTVEFDATYGDTNVNLIAGDGTDLTGGDQDFTATTIQNPAGPEWFDVGANWVGGDIPDNGSTIWLVNSSVSIRWGLNHPEINPARFVKDSTYTGEIGNPRWNADGNFFEYRDTELTLGQDGTGPSSTTWEFGQGDGQDSALVRINAGNKEAHVTVSRTGNSSEQNVPALCFRSTHTDSTFNAMRGHVGIGFFPGQSAEVATLQMSYIDSVESDVTVVIGEGVNVGAIQKTGGTLWLNAGADSLEQLAGVTTTTGTGPVIELEVIGGTVFSNSTGKVGHWGAITGITKANPAVVTSTAHGLTTGQKVRIASVGGMVEVNQLEFTVEVATADTFKLVGINSTGYTTYTAGGTWSRLDSVVVTGEGVLDFSQSNAARQVAPAIDVYGDEGIVKDTGKRLTTLSYLTGEFAIHYHRTTRDEDLGIDYILVRRG